ncbi:MAG: neutral zinc metallopeptidase [Desulfobacterales bacterium]|jgi:predicted metalloprotease
MRWRNRRRSTNIEDRRRHPVGRKIAGGGLGTIVLVLIGLYFGIDPGVILQSTGNLSPTPQTSTGALSPAEQELGDFVAAVLADTEDTWHAIFQQEGGRYREPKLVLFSGAVESACGYAQSATGPFYCPADEKVYIDLSFFEALQNRFGAPGDFAQAYVIAHEIGHHVQTLTGISAKVHQAKRQRSEREANALSVRQELQADCFAGLWAHHADRARQLLEAGDIEEALNAANAIGDDRLQRKSHGQIVPDSFTHGTSAQRVKWFKRGFTAGRLASCDTFNTPNP